ncbi:MAG: DUF2029 domain-containing protein [Bryobacterales bacterium]|nr:DUF2029 domain-containing protein [Bryobacterales bacterium]
MIAGLLAVAFLGGLALMQADWLRTGPANDFLSFYSAADASDIYAQSSIDAARPPAFAAVPASARPYARIPLHAKLFSFLRPLAYPTAYLVFQVVMLWCMGAFVFGWLPENRALTLAASAVSVPLFFGFMRGQDWPLVLAALAGCAVAERYRAPILAGFCLSVAAIHPAAVIAAPLLLIAHRRWAMCTGFLSGLTVMATVSFWTAGLDWPQRFAAAFVAAAPADPATMPNLMGTAAWLNLGPWAAAVAGVAVAIAVYLVCRRESMVTSLGCVAAAGLLLSPQARLEDAVLLLPAGLALLASEQHWGVRLIGLLLLTPMFFLPQLGDAATHVLVLLAFTALLLAALLPSQSEQAEAGTAGLAQLKLS